MHSLLHPLSVSTFVTTCTIVTQTLPFLLAPLSSAPTVSVRHLFLMKTNIFGHHVGVEFIHDRCTYACTLSSFEFVSCQCLFDNLLYPLACPSTTFCLDVAFSVGHLHIFLSKSLCVAIRFVPPTARFFHHTNTQHRQHVHKLS